MVLFFRLSSSLTLATLCTLALSHPVMASTKDEDSPKPLSITFTLAPTIGSDFNQVRGDNLSDAVTKSSLALEYDWNVSETIKVTTSTGVEWTSDFEGDDDNESKSAFYAGTKVSWNRGCRTINPFASYRYESGYSDFLDVRGADTGTFAVGADIQVYGKRACATHLSEETLKAMSDFTLTVSSSIERLESSDPLSERWAPRVAVNASQKVGGGIKLTGSLDYQFRNFDEVESGSNRIHRFAGEAGVDFAELIFGPPERTVVSELKLGISWELVDQENTGILRDTSATAFTPQISVSKSF